MMCAQDWKLTQSRCRPNGSCLVRGTLFLKSDQVRAASCAWTSGFTSRKAPAARAATTSARTEAASMPGRKVAATPVFGAFGSAGSPILGALGVLGVLLGGGGPLLSATSPVAGFCVTGGSAAGSAASAFAASVDAASRSGLSGPGGLGGL